MKKLICAAAMSALCATVFAIESENIVGYQQIDIPNGYSFFTATFENITDTDFNLSDIACKQADGSEWLASGKSATKCNGTVYVRKIATNGAYGTQYKYYSTKTPVGWYNGDTQVTGAAVKFEPGEGMIVYCGNSSGATLQVSGSVRLVAANKVVPNGYSFSGNSSPVAIKLSAVACKQADGSEWLASGKSATKCNGTVYVRKIATNGAYGTQYKYYSTKTPVGWYDGDTQITGENDVTFEPGEGFIVYCGNSSGAQVVLPAPEL